MWIFVECIQFAHDIGKLEGFCEHGDEHVDSV
jgi:hypothetical protein